MKTKESASESAVAASGIEQLATPIFGGCDVIRERIVVGDVRERLMHFPRVVQRGAQRQDRQRVWDGIRDVGEEELDD